MWCIKSYRVPYMCSPYDFRWFPWSCCHLLCGGAPLLATTFLVVVILPPPPTNHTASWPPCSLGGWPKTHHVWMGSSCTTGCWSKVSTSLGAKSAPNNSWQSAFEVALPPCTVVSSLVPPIPHSTTKHECPQLSAPGFFLHMLLCRNWAQCHQNW